MSPHLYKWNKQTDWHYTLGLSLSCVSLTWATVHIKNLWIWEFRSPAAISRILLRKWRGVLLQLHCHITASVMLLYSNPQFNKRFVVVLFAALVLMRQMEAVCLGGVVSSRVSLQICPHAVWRNQSVQLTHTHIINIHHHRITLIYSIVFCIMLL